MNDVQAKNKKMVLYIVGTVLFMVVLSFASVPLYRMFCAVTGIDGTMRIGGEAPGKASERVITVSFDARVNQGLPWQFKPERRKLDVFVGQSALISYEGTNLSAKVTKGTAIYNVTPFKVAKYFYKTQCFCFAEQVLNPGKSAQFPVMFYIDPALLKDPEMNDVTDITLSYTFFTADSEELQKALSNFEGKIQ